MASSIFEQICENRQQNVDTRTEGVWSTFRDVMLICATINCVAPFTVVVFFGNTYVTFFFT